VTERSPYLRFLAVVVGTALALRIAWLLIRPLLPVIAVLLAAFAVWQLVRWYRGRL
jgi:predicted PurR-regulated permease PerM